MAGFTHAIDVSDWKLKDINDFCIRYNCFLDLDRLEIILMEVEIDEEEKIVRR